MSRKVVVLGGDGIGPEVTREAVKVLRALNLDLEFQEALVGGIAIDETGDALPEATLELCRDSDAVLLGAVGGPKWDALQPPSRRPELAGLLRLRKELQLYANVRPAKTHQALLNASPLKPREGGMDLIVIRELTGGIYFGEPRGRSEDGYSALDTCVYHRFEVERIARRGFAIARQRRKKLLSVDKANVLETSRFWREIVNEIATEFPDVEVNHMLVDNCAMQLIRDPGQFDVILTENLFGDILSDEASMITGSLGLLPSASLSDSKGDSVYGLYEPVHGSAPDIAGQGKANPIAAILSAAMMLKYSFGLDEASGRIEAAVEAVLGEGPRTPDIAEEGLPVGTTEQVGDAVVARLAVSG